MDLGRRLYIAHADAMRRAGRVVVMGANPPYRKNRRTASASAAAAAATAAAAITARLARHLALRMITDREAERTLFKEVHAARARHTKGFVRSRRGIVIQQYLRQTFSSFTLGYLRAVLKITHR